METSPSFFRWPFLGPYFHSRSPPRPGKGAAGAISYSKSLQEESGGVGFGEVLRIWGGGRVEGLKGRDGIGFMDEGVSRSGTARR